MADHCPRTLALSALLDGQLQPRQRRELLAHIDRCAACGERLRELETLRSRFQALPQERLGFDLGAVIEARLRVQPRPSRTARRPGMRWLLFPLSGAAALTLGLYLGSTLIRSMAGDMPAGPPMLAMAVFDPIPPGNLCPVPKSCPSGNGFR
ncbi:anti-sigma factor family protein [Aromatoleum anaerobium]|uniref:Zf-HC2 domain-containing protein n=1 Tax=Aromatoleum anaerobium TaxID=182180 RepID=A0ABX1PN57_9RHOO|nr:zf-HC2 domain-containing protein [Aromatoleum anaerobium]MCK0509132.1 zf-HC2 domain-containing protein [Aromatoleum anaerobium]